MIEKGRLSTRQIAILMFIFLLGESVLIYPSVITALAKQDAWLVSLAALPFGVMVVWILLRLHRKYPDQNLIQISHTVLGKWFGSILSLWYLFFFYISTALFIRQIGDFLNTQYFSNTPLRIIILLFIGILIWGVSAGIEPLGRTAEIMFPFLLLAFTFLVIFLLPQSEFTELKPIMEAEPLAILHTIFVVISYPFGQSVVFSMLFPLVNKQSHMGRDVLVMAAAAGLLLTIILLTSLLVLGSFLSESTIYTTFFLAKKVSIGDFLQRMEAILTTAWIVTTFFKTVLYYYASILGTAQLFKLNSYQSLIWVVALIFFGLSIVVSPDMEYYVSDFISSWTLWDLTSGLVIPLLLLILPAWSLRKKVKANKH
ncbi:GerAB/ArcD/ProY family transporter [Paenibacillus massiliensis]|uniref:GerAB/ArcD/ProY family transporter n=1 Tax=Paenibacillus massiliensis TaxID=225917 RepID=UPI00040ECA6C|nr:endospore germination permease [Paenibacillus massiliensis]